MNIVFLGPPGSGKGTQAQRLAADLKLTHLSTGDVFRENIQGKTPLGQKIKSFVDGGKLVPDTLVSEVVFDKLRRSMSGVLLDGYPRTLEQSKDFESFSAKESFAIDVVVSFEVDAPALVKRLSARRSCGTCKEVYNLNTRAPKVAGTCDKCGNALIQRQDDKAEVVQERLKVYDQQTAPILNFYKSLPNFVRINADQAIDKVYSDLKAAIERAGSVRRK